MVSSVQNLNHRTTDSIFSVPKYKAGDIERFTKEKGVGRRTLIFYILLFYICLINQFEIRIKMNIFTAYDWPIGFSMSVNCDN